MKKVIRLTENDLRKIVNRIIEITDPIDIAKNVVMTGVFNEPSSTKTSSPENTGSNEEADVIKKASQVGVSSGEWARNQSTSPKIQLSYKKSQNDKKWTPLAQMKTPNNVKRTNGKWSISNNKLNITD